MTKRDVACAPAFAERVRHGDCAEQQDNPRPINRVAVDKDETKEANNYNTSCWLFIHNETHLSIFLISRQTLFWATSFCNLQGATAVHSHSQNTNRDRRAFFYSSLPLLTPCSASLSRPPDRLLVFCGSPSGKDSFLSLICSLICFLSLLVKCIRRPHRYSYANHIST
jgi:hypothetical protein